MTKDADTTLATGPTNIKIIKCLDLHSSKQVLLFDCHLDSRESECLDSAHGSRARVIFTICASFSHAQF